jgi:isopenicillin N synthase-like dioxygenase
MNSRATGTGVAVAIPEITVNALFGGPSAERDAVDWQIFAAATNVGFMTIALSPCDAALSVESRRRLLGIFTLEDAEVRKHSGGLAAKIRSIPPQYLSRLVSCASRYANLQGRDRFWARCRLRRGRRYIRSAA